MARPPSSLFGALRPNFGHWSLPIAPRERFRLRLMGAYRDGCICCSRSTMPHVPDRNCSTLGWHFWARGSTCTSNPSTAAFRRLLSDQHPCSASIAHQSEAMPPSIKPNMLLGYRDIVEGIDNKSIILIDVREPQELEETAVLPTSINIPINDLKAALESLSLEEFKEKYNIPLPNKDDPLVFSCRSGNRSMKALLIALELGYINSKHYTGGYLDWAKRKGDSK